MTAVFFALVAQTDFGASAGIDLGSSMMSVATMNSAIGVGLHKGGSKATRPVPDTRFHADPAVTARVRRQYLDFLARKVSPSSSQRAAEFFRKVDFKQAWTKQDAFDGLRNDNVAYAAAAYFALNWCIANGKDGFTPASAKALLHQFGPVIFGTAAFRRLGNAQRQEMAEVWQINFVAQEAGYAVARKDPALLRKMREAAVTWFKSEAKIDLNAVRLTDEGFVRA